MANSSFKNNIIYRTVSGTIQNASSGQTAVWDHNCIYESTSLPSDPNLITANPLLMNPGSGATGMNTLDGYKLQSGSPVLNSGILVANNGGRDYFGNSVSSSLSPNIGAYNGLASAPTGITSPQEQWMEMYPNPASEVLYIYTNENTSGKKLLNIYKITGQKVASYEYCGSVYSINISHLKEGLYIVELNDGNLKSFRKISIE